MIVEVGAEEPAHSAHVSLEQFNEERRREMEREGKRGGRGGRGESGRARERGRKGEVGGREGKGARME